MEVCDNPRLLEAIQNLEYIEWMVNHLDFYEFRGVVAEQLKNDFIKYASSPNVYYTSCIEITRDFYEMTDDNPFNSVLGILAWENYIRVKSQDAFMIPFRFQIEDRQEVFYIPTGFAMQYESVTTNYLMQNKKKMGKQKLEETLKEVISSLGACKNSMYYIPFFRSKKKIGEDKDCGKTRYQQGKSMLRWEKILSMICILLWVFVARVHVWYRGGAFFLFPSGVFRYTTKTYSILGAGLTLLMILLFFFFLTALFLVSLKAIYLKNIKAIDDYYSVIEVDYQKVDSLLRRLTSNEDLLSKKLFSEPEYHYDDILKAIDDSKLRFAFISDHKKLERRLSRLWFSLKPAFFTGIGLLIFVYIASLFL